MVRVKYRYLLIQIETNNQLNYCHLKNPLPFTEFQLKNWVINQVELNFGDLGCSYLLSSFSIKYFSKETGLAILRVSIDFYQQLWSCLTLINQLDKEPVVISVLHCSGTIIKCQRVAIQHNKKLIYSTYNQLNQMKALDDSLDIDAVEKLIEKERALIEATQF